MHGRGDIMLEEVRKDRLVSNNITLQTESYVFHDKGGIGIPLPM